MTAKQGLATPTIEIDNRIIAIKPNSLSFDDGEGELNVRPQVAGAGVVENVITINAESQRSMVKFGLATTAEAVALKSEIKNKSINGQGVGIRFSDAGFTRSFRNMRLINNVEVAIGQDADFELELQGDPSA